MMKTSDLSKVNNNLKKSKGEKGGMKTSTKTMKSIRLLLTGDRA